MKGGRAMKMTMALLKNDVCKMSACCCYCFKNDQKQNSLFSMRSYNLKSFKY